VNRIATEMSMQQEFLSPKPETFDVVTRRSVPRWAGEVRVISSQVKQE